MRYRYRNAHGMRVFLLALAAWLSLAGGCVHSEGADLSEWANDQIAAIAEFPVDFARQWLAAWLL